MDSSVSPLHATAAFLGHDQDEARPLAVPGRLRRAAVAIGDLLGAVAIVLCVPFVMLAIGIPIALGARLLLWMGAMVATGR